MWNDFLRLYNNCLYNLYGMYGDLFATTIPSCKDRTLIVIKTPISGFLMTMS